MFDLKPEDQPPDRNNPYQAPVDPRDRMSSFNRPSDPRVMAIIIILLFLGIPVGLILLVQWLFA